jgi:hypothetical protein
VGVATLDARLRNTYYPAAQQALLESNLLDLTISELRKILEISLVTVSKLYNKTFLISKILENEVAVDLYHKMYPTSSSSRSLGDHSGNSEAAQVSKMRSKLAALSENQLLKILSTDNLHEDKQTLIEKILKSPAALEKYYEVMGEEKPEEKKAQSNKRKAGVDREEPRKKSKTDSGRQ